MADPDRFYIDKAGFRVYNKSRGVEISLKGGRALNRIITIGREFGSGGRELGKRLADHLGIAYYDREILEELSRRTKLDEGYLHRVAEQRNSLILPITVGRTLHHTAGSDYLVRQYTAVYAEQANILRELAEASDCIIVGRCADYILKEFKPVRLFVYADMDAKVERCRQRAEAGEGLSEREMKNMIRKVDRNRARYYSYYTGQTWGERGNYDLCVNTTGIPVKALAESLAHLFS